ncbi:MAG: septum formation initiator family protein [Eubacterium sp.]|nr:septum formation initiator family protein [Eubacterium sp.]
MSKRVVRRKRKQSGFVLFLAMLIMFMVVAACTVRSIGLYRKSKELKVVKANLETQLQEANIKSEQLKEKELYMQTKDYIEDEAKNKLGLVYPDEIVIKPKDSDD